MELLVVVFVCFVAFVSIGGPLLFAPLTVTGVISLAPLHRAHVFSASLLVFGFSFCLVVGNVIRGSFGQHRLLRKIAAMVGGCIALIVLILFFMSIGLSNGQHVLVPLWMLWAVSMIVYKITKQFPPKTRFHPLMVFLHLTVAALTIMSTMSKLLHLTEAVKPLQLLSLVAERTETSSVVTPVVHAAQFLWSWAGLTWDWIRVSASLLVVFLVCLGYALTGPSKHHEPASPVTICGLVFVTGWSLMELVPLLFLLAVRFSCDLVFGRALVVTVHENGLSECWTEEFHNKVNQRKRVYRATDYDEWLRAEEVLEKAEDRGAWRQENASQYYEHERVAIAIDMLRHEAGAAKMSGDPSKLVELLRSMLNRNFANINDPRLFRFPASGTKKQIEVMLDEIVRSLDLLCSWDWGDQFGRLAKWDFVRSAEHIVGKTGLCLSGGGSSGGSIVAGFLACNTDAEMAEFMKEGSLEQIQNGLRDENRKVVPWFDSCFTMIRRFTMRGVLVDREQFLRVLGPTGMKDYTFKEAFDRTGRLVNITTSTKDLGETLLLNHLNSPHVLVRSAVQCSCALNGVMHPGSLLVKRPDGRIEELNSAGTQFRDGSFQHDIPMQGLRSQFHVQHFIISQVNPYLPLFLKDSTEPVSKLQAFQGFLTKRLRHRLNLLVDLHVLPTEVHVMAQQQFAGTPQDITMCPKQNIHDLTWRILCHPTEGSMRHFILEGKRMAWPHLRRIQYQTQLETAISKLTTYLDPLHYWSSRSTGLTPPQPTRTEGASDHSCTDDQSAQLCELKSMSKVWAVFTTLFGTRVIILFALWKPRAETKQAKDPPQLSQPLNLTHSNRQIMQATKMKLLSDQRHTTRTSCQNGSQAQQVTGDAAVPKAQEAAAIAYRQEKLASLFAMSQLDLDAPTERYSTPTSFPRDHQEALESHQEVLAGVSQTKN